MSSLVIESSVLGTVCAFFPFLGLLDSSTRKHSSSLNQSLQRSNCSIASSVNKIIIVIIVIIIICENYPPINVISSKVCNRTALIPEKRKDV
jgi:hypothetical protein